MEEVPLGLLLWQRIRALGVQSIMGVPGDMNLELLDYINQVEGLQWVGNANELNASYAADAYCRVKGVPGVLVTTMGVGELSALNGVAGAYTEQVKVIHIVGTTSASAQRNRAMIHHCLGPSPDHRVYEKISSHVRATYCWLDDVHSAATEIDRVIRACYTTSLPVYIFVPMDLVNSATANVPAMERISGYSSNGGNQAAALSHTLDLIYSSKSPSLIVDALVARHRATDATRELADLLNFATYTTSMGKGIIHETKPYFRGVYNGKVSFDGVRKAIEEDSDIVIDLGPFLSDSNTGGFTRQLSDSRLIAVNPTSVSVAGRLYEQIEIRSFIEALLQGIDKARIPHSTLPAMATLPASEDMDSPNITQSWLWTRLGHFVRPKDILIAESGTAQFGLPDARLPSDVLYLTQVYYGSIGYSVPACFGAAIAQRELGTGGRVILVVGDGSLQLTVQEVGSMVKNGLKNIIIIVINNGGYTIERAIHGPEEAYNDIATWDHQNMLTFFGARDGNSSSRVAKTKTDFEKIARLPEYDHPKIELLEIYMDVMDIPWRLREQIRLINERNKQQARPKVNGVH